MYSSLVQRLRCPRKSLRSLPPARALAAMFVIAACVEPQDEVRVPAASPPIEAAPAAIVPAPEPQPAAAPPEDEDDSPNIVAYPPPRIENVFVRRSGPEVNLVIRVSRVRGAGSYELEVAKTLMFEPLLAAGSAPGRVVKLGPLVPGMFFVHARAVGKAGEGPFGDVRVVHAEANGVAKLRGLSAEDVAEPTLAGLPPEKGPAMPALASNSTPAPNLEPVQQRYEQLRRELAEVEAVRREVQAKVVELQGRLAGAKAKSAASLKTELETLESVQAQLDREIAAVLAELAR